MAWPQVHPVLAPTSCELRVDRRLEVSGRTSVPRHLRRLSADHALLVGDNRDHRRSWGCRLRSTPGGTPGKAPTNAATAAIARTRTTPRDRPACSWRPDRTANRDGDAPPAPAIAPPRQRRRTGGGWHGPRQHPGPVAARPRPGNLVRRLPHGRGRPQRRGRHRRPAPTASGVPPISRRVGYLAPAGEAWMPADCLR